MSYTVTVTVHVDGSGHGVLHNTATVGAQQTDPNPGNNSGSDDVEVLGADLQVTKVKKSPATVVTGNTVVYEIKVKSSVPRTPPASSSPTRCRPACPASPPTRAPAPSPLRT